MTSRLFSSSATAGRALGVTLLAGMLTAGAAGCADSPAPDSSTTAPTSSSRLALSAQVDEGFAVARVGFDIERVSCDGEAFTPLRRSAVVELFHTELPPDLVDLEEMITGAGHRFTDHFELLPAGCYDVTIRPLGADGTMSSGCSATTQRGVEVRDGVTTEILLLSQCSDDSAAGPSGGQDTGDVEGPTGGLDTIAAFNHAPVLKALTFDPSKFAAACTTTTICATASDVDGDDLEFAWTQTGGPDGAASPAVISSSASGDERTECVTVRADIAGAYGYQVAVYDLLATDDGASRRVEDALGDGQSSHDGLSFPYYVIDDGQGTCPPAPGDGGDDVGDDGDDGDGETPPPTCQPISCDDLKGLGSGVQGGTARLVVPEGACPIQVSFTSYGLPSGKVRPFTEQYIVDNVTDTYGPGVHTLEVDLPMCAWQSDLYCGDTVDLQAGEIHGHKTLGLDWEEGQACQPEPEPACTPVDDEDLRRAGTSVQGGQATLVVPDNACPVEVSFSSYDLPLCQVQPFEDQILRDNVTATYGPGTYQLSVDVPASCWQTDIYTGPVLPVLVPGVGHPADRLIDWDLDDTP